MVHFMRKLYSKVFLIVLLMCSFPAFPEERWDQILKQKFINDYIELKPAPFDMAVKKLYPDFARVRVSFVRDNSVESWGILFIYNKNNPNENFLYRGDEELAKILLNRYGYKVKSEGDVAKYITPIINITEAQKISDTKYYLFTGETFFESKSGYLLETSKEGIIENVEKKLRLDEK